MRQKNAEDEYNKDVIEKEENLSTDTESSTSEYMYDKHKGEKEVIVEKNLKFVKVKKWMMTEVVRMLLQLQK